MALVRPVRWANVCVVPIMEIRGVGVESGRSCQVDDETVVFEADHFDSSLFLSKALRYHLTFCWLSNHLVVSFVTAEERAMRCTGCFFGGLHQVVRFQPAPRFRLPMSLESHHRIADWISPFGVLKSLAQPDRA